MIGVVDCNNFYASCERVFHPELRGQPVVVLSNNDGCVIARSAEAKDMGIKMGLPFYQVKNMMDEGLLHVFSSNYTLYGDMSRRVMAIVREMVPRMEVYSIDEAFLHFRGVKDVHQLGLEISERVELWTGIPVSVGISFNKTLAKLASKFAKKYRGYRGCCIIDTENKRMKALQLTKIDDVWGVGRRMRKRLNDKNVMTAYDFTLWSRQQVEHEFGIQGVRTWQELRGMECYDIEAAIAKKSITTSRSFKETVADFDELNRYVADFAAHCAQKLRKEKGYASEVIVFIRTSIFRQDLPQYENAAKVMIDVPTSDVRELVNAASQGLNAIFRNGYGYKQAGVTVANIMNGVVATNMYDTVDREKQEHFLQTIDFIQAHYGYYSIKVALQGDCSGNMNRKYASPCYTTNLDDVIKVKIQ